MVRSFILSLIYGIWFEQSFLNSQFFVKETNIICALVKYILIIEQVHLQ
jgi:hypothetical protein